MMRIGIIVLTVFFAAIAFSQDSRFVATTLRFDCEEVINYRNLKNNRLIAFQKNESGYKADFIFRLTCCAEYDFIARYSGDSLHLSAEQTNNLSCDCSCYYKVSVQLPFLDPDLIFWNDGEYIGVRQTEFIEYPVTFELWKGDTINYRDQLKRAQGTFILGENKDKPSGILSFENDCIVSGWRVLDYHPNGTPSLIETLKVHTIGDGSVYTNLDSTQNVVSRCYRYFPHPLKYVEFCDVDEFVVPEDLNSSRPTHIVFLNDSLVMEYPVRKVSYKAELEKIMRPDNSTIVVLLVGHDYSVEFLSFIEGIGNEKVRVVRKELNER